MTELEKMVEILKKSGFPVFRSAQIVGQLKHNKIEGNYKVGFEVGAVDLEAYQKCVSYDCENQKLVVLVIPEAILHQGEVVKEGAVLTEEWDSDLPAGC